MSTDSNEQREPKIVDPFTDINGEENVLNDDPLNVADIFSSAAFECALQEATKRLFQAQLDAFGISPADVIQQLSSLPDEMLALAQDTASKRKDKYEAAEYLKTKELPHKFTAQAEGKNTESRALLFEKACSDDDELLSLRQRISRLELDIASNEATREMLATKCHNLRYIARLMAAFGAHD